MWKIFDMPPSPRELLRFYYQSSVAIFCFFPFFLHQQDGSQPPLHSVIQWIFWRLGFRTKYRASSICVDDIIFLSYLWAFAPWLSTNSENLHYRVSGRRPFVCDACGSTFAQLSSLKSHKSSVHEGKFSIFGLWYFALWWYDPVVCVFK